MKTKLTLTLLLLFCAGLTMQAQTPKQQLVVWQKNGDKVRFDLAELPETTFKNGQLVVTTSTQQGRFRCVLGDSERCEV